MAPPARERGRPDSLHAKIAPILTNPFEARRDEERERAARELDVLIEEGGVAAVLETMLTQGMAAEATDLVLAIELHRDRERPTRAPVVPNDLVERLQLKKPDVEGLISSAKNARAALNGIAGSSEVMRRCKAEAWTCCFGESLSSALLYRRIFRRHHVVLLGESGTGKELFANAIQLGTAPAAEGVNDAPRVKVNCAAITESLVDAELFGHTKGSFSGATKDREGWIRSAHRGSIFLDEVGDLSLPAQAKLLRAIETKEVIAVGSDKPEAADARYIAATHRNLDALVQSNKFRRDLLFRLSGSVIRIPPLHERPEDIEETAIQLARETVDHAPELKAETTTRVTMWVRTPEFQAQSWPGNVRELRAAVQRVVLGLPPFPPVPTTTEEGADAPVGLRKGKWSLSRVKKWYVRRALTAAGSVAGAARALGVDQGTIRRSLARSRHGS